MAVFDTMRHIGPDVSTICVGLAASMGAFLLASGHVVGLDLLYLEHRFSLLEICTPVEGSYKTATAVVLHCSMQMTIGSTVTQNRMFY